MMMSEGAEDFYRGVREPEKAEKASDDLVTVTGTR